MTTAPTVQWQNRIVGYADVNPTVLLPNEMNWRTHSEEQEQALAAVLAEVGLVQNVVVNSTTTTFEIVGEEETGEDIINIFRTGNGGGAYVEHVRLVTPHLIDGHLRTAMAVKYHQPSIPVTFVELTQAEEDKILATYDPLSAMARIDNERLSALHARLSVEDETLQTLLADLADQAGLYTHTFDPVETNAQFAANPYAGKEYQAKKQVSVLLTMEEFATFNTAVKQLGEHYATDVLGQVLLATLTDAAATIPEPRVGPKRERVKKTAPPLLKVPETPKALTTVMASLDESIPELV